MLHYSPFPFCKVSSDVFLFHLFLIAGPCGVYCLTESGLTGRVWPRALVAVLGPPSWGGRGSLRVWLLFALGRRLQAHGLQWWPHGAQSSWHLGSATLWRVDLSKTRGRTCVPCTGRWVLTHRATRKPLYC